MLAPAVPRRAEERKGFLEVVRRLGAAAGPPPDGDAQAEERAGDAEGVRQRSAYGERFLLGGTGRRDVPTKAASQPYAQACAELAVR